MPLIRTTLATLFGLAALLAFPNAHATLIDRGNGLIYDDVLDITWMQDASFVGNLKWDLAVMWADTLVFGGFDDWRLPSISVSAGLPTGGPVPFADVVVCSEVTELECRDNELGYMYYQNLGGMGDLTGNQGLIQNIRPVHWSGTEFLGGPNPESAWSFTFRNGGQGASAKSIFGVITAWAVRDGDVLAVPEPATGLLFVAGLAGLGCARSRRAKLAIHR